MTDAAFIVLDGINFRSTDFTLPESETKLTGTQLLVLAESRASSSLHNVSLPESLLSSAFKRLSLDEDLHNFRLMELDNDRGSCFFKDYLTAITDEIRDDPLVISIFDGSSLRLFLEDEDDFAMLAETLFTELDTQDIGKISKSSGIRNALIHMGLQLTIPPFSEFPQLNDLLKKHGAEGEGQLGQSQFALLLQPILQELADSLAENHVVVIHKVRIINGSKLRKLLADEKHLNEVIEKILQEKRIVKEKQNTATLIRGFLEENGKDLGLPTSESDETVGLLYDTIFADLNNKTSATEMENDDLMALFKEILENFADQLEANPVFHEL